MKNNKIFKQIILLSVFIPQLFFAQGGYRFEEYEESVDFDLTKFNAEEYFIAAIICAILIVVGFLLLKKYPENKFFKFVACVLILLGGLGAFIYLLVPLLGAIKILFQAAGAIFIVVFVIKSIMDVTSDKNKKDNIENDN